MIAFVLEKKDWARFSLSVKRAFFLPRLRRNREDIPFKEEVDDPKNEDVPFKEEVDDPKNEAVPFKEEVADPKNKAVPFKEEVDDPKEKAGDPKTIQMFQKKSRDDLKGEAKGKPKTSHEAEGDPTPDSGF